jgi:hypothetical protein
MEFEIKSQTYRAGKLSAFQQFHVSRRLAPLLASLGGSLDEMRADPLSLFAPIAQGIASLPDADADFVLNTCLGTVQRAQGQAWARVMAPGGGLMFEDIGMPEMLQIVGRVLMENFADFFADLPGFAPGNPASDSSP